MIISGRRKRRMLEHLQRERAVKLLQERNSFAAKVYPDMSQVRVYWIIGTFALIGFTVPQIVMFASFPRPIDPEIMWVVVHVIMIPGASIGIIFMLIAIGFHVKARWADRQMEKWDAEHS